MDELIEKSKQFQTVCTVPDILYRPTLEVLPSLAFPDIEIHKLLYHRCGLKGIEKPIQMVDCTTKKTFSLSVSSLISFHRDSEKKKQGIFFLAAITCKVFTLSM